MTNSSRIQLASSCLQQNHKLNINNTSTAIKAQSIITVVI